MNQAQWKIPKQREGLSDWSGSLLDPQILHRVSVGHIVRIQVQQFEDSSRGWITTPYVRITRAGDDELTGIVEDPYRSSNEPDVSNGVVVDFSRQSIIEIPTDWDGNAELEAVAIRTGGSRMSGILPPSD